MNPVGCYTSVLVLNLFLVLNASIKYVVSTHKQNSENLFPFFGYLQGFKLGQNLALQLPPYVLSPIVIVPVMNQNQDLQLEPKTIEDYEKNVYHTRNISYSKLSSNFTVNSGVIQDNEIKQTIEKDFPVKEKRLAEDTATDSLRQAIGNDSDINGTTEINEVLSTTSTLDLNNSSIENIFLNNETTITPGPYPLALYNNEFLNNLTITTEQVQQNVTLPSTENNLNNFSLSSNVSKVVLSNINVKNNSTDFGIISTTQTSDITNLYPYPNAISNSMADRLSITKNSYLDEGNYLPPPYDDRWQSFSSLTKLYPNSGFRPLAGLYYDGFLHKSLNKNTGFIPFGGKHNHYEQYN